MDITRNNSSRRFSWAALGITALALLALAALLIVRNQGGGANAGADPSRVAGVATGIFSGSTGSYGVRVLGVVVDRNMRVVGLDAGGAAERAGIRKGDTITKVNATSVASSSDSKRLVQQPNGDQPTTVTLTRDGQELTIPVPSVSRQGASGQPTPTPVPADLGYF